MTYSDSTEMFDCVRLRDLSFRPMQAIWGEASRVGMAWFPELSGSIESRVACFDGRELLSTLALYVRETTPDNADMEQLSRLIAFDSRCLAMLDIMSGHRTPEVRRVARRCRDLCGNFWSDPLGFLVLNIKEWRVRDVAFRWPRDWLP